MVNYAVSDSSQPFLLNLIGSTMFKTEKHKIFITEWHLSYRGTNICFDERI